MRSFSFSRAGAPWFGGSCGQCTGGRERQQVPPWRVASRAHRAPRAHRVVRHPGVGSTGPGAGIAANLPGPDSPRIASARRHSARELRRLRTPRGAERVIQVIRHLGTARAPETVQQHDAGRELGQQTEIRHRIVACEEKMAADAVRNEHRAQRRSEVRMVHIEAAPPTHRSRRGGTIRQRGGTHRRPSHGAGHRGEGS
jgi:hypothetical protein